MKIFLSGGAGYIGHELTVELSRNKDVTGIVIYDNLIRRNYSLFIDKRIENCKKIEFVNGDVLDSGKMSQNLKGCDMVIHLAGTVPGPLTRQQPHLFEQVNQWGSAELARLASENGIKNFIYLSSAAVYGKRDEPIHHLSAPSPESYYATTKLKGEKLVDMFSENINPVIFRTSSIYGYSPSARFDSLINRFIFEVNFIGRLQYHGNGDQKRSFIHISEVAGVLNRLASDPSILGPGTYNLTERVLSINEVAETIQSLYPISRVIKSELQTDVYQRIIQPDVRLTHLQRREIPPLVDELLEFVEKYAFSTPFTGITHPGQMISN